MGNKYYVGKTTNLVNRIDQHLKGTACEFTRIYPVLQNNPVYQVIENCSGFDEDKYVKIMMLKYGINNVRGGSYISINLKPEEIFFLERELRMATDVCLECGQAGHFVNNCPNKIPLAATPHQGDIFSFPYITQSLTSGWVILETYIPSLISSIGNLNLHAPLCIAPRSQEVSDLQEENENIEKPKKLNEEKAKALREAIRRRELENNEKEPEVKDINSINNEETGLCSRCGRNTHTINNCYAKTHYQTKENLPLYCYKCRSNGHSHFSCDV